MIKETLKDIFKVSYVITFTIMLYIGVIHIANIQPFTKFYASVSGYAHYSQNQDLISDDNIIKFYNIIDPHGLKYPNYNILELPENKFRQLIVYLKDIDEGNLYSPCQYFSYMWARYYDYHEITYKYHFIEGHTFLIVERDFGYSIVDQDYIENVYIMRNLK